MHDIHFYFLICIYRSNYMHKHARKTYPARQPSDHRSEREREYNSY